MKKLDYTPAYKFAARSTGITPAQLNALEALAWSPDAEVWIMDLGIPRASVRKLAKAKLVKIRRCQSRKLDLTH